MGSAPATQANLTPLPVVRQGLVWWQKQRMYPDPRRILDPAAGSGAFGVVLRELFPRAHITAMEARVEEHGHLRSIYDEVLGSFPENLPDDAPPFRPYDLVVTNPPFVLWEDYVEFSLDYVTQGGDVLMLGLNDWGQRNMSTGYDFFRTYTPVYQARISGSLGFRGPGESADTRCYSWWLWREGSSISPTQWLTTTLPPLDSDGRRWTTPPGR